MINPHPSILSPQSPAAASAISWIVHCHESGCLDFHQSIINQLLSHPPSQQYTHLASSFNSPFHPLSCHSMELPLQWVLFLFPPETTLDHYRPYISWWWRLCWKSIRFPISNIEWVHLESAGPIWGAALIEFRPEHTILKHTGQYWPAAYQPKPSRVKYKGRH